MTGKVEVSERKAAFAELKDWCIMSVTSKEKTNTDFLEVTEWSNGEGYDIHISDSSGEKHFDLTCGQFEALKKCIKAIDKPKK
jgi:hypothetical protein